MAEGSIVDLLKSQNKSSDLQSRAQLAVDNGLVKTTQEYLTRAASGTNGDINTALYQKLSAPPAPGATSPTSQTTSPAVSSSSINGTTPVVSNAPLTSTQLADAATSPNPTTFVQANTGNRFADMVSNVAKANITEPNKLAIDSLKADLQARTTAEKTTTEANVNNYEGQIKSLVNSTATKDALDAAFETYKIRENLALYNDIQTRVVEAQKALDLGLIYEGDRPARMSFITGAKSTLQKQGLATIGALQGTAAVIKGNLDLARSFADATVNAINSDNERSFKALTTLLDLENGKLIRLSADEKATINDRLTSIEAEADRLQKNKDDVVSYMTQFPSAFLKGGVTLLDNQETALKKMLPYLSADEQAKLQADLDLKKSQAAQNYAAAGKDSAGKNDTPEVKKYKDEITQLFNKGVPYNQVLAAYGALVPISYINDLYGQKDSLSYDERIKNQFYSQMTNPDGSLKPGFKFDGTLDAQGKPKIVKDNGAGDGFWSNIGQAFGSIFSKKQ